jgi:hypothetical protein
VIFIRSFYCAILLLSVAGCGGSTSAETISPAGNESSVTDATGGPADAARTNREAFSRTEAAASVSEPDPISQSSLPPESQSAADSGSKSEASTGETEIGTNSSETVVPQNSPREPAEPGPEPAQPSAQLRSRTVLDGILTLDVPDEFQAMPNDMREQRYAAGQRPSFVLTNAAGNVNIAFNVTQNEMTLDQLPDFQRRMAALFRGQVEGDDWIGSSTTQVNGLDWFTIEMRTEAFGTKVWNLIAGTSLDGRLLLVSFNATTELESEWQPACRQMLQSVKIAAEPIQQPELSATK